MPIIVKGIITQEEYYEKQEQLKKSKGFEAPEYLIIETIKKLNENAIFLLEKIYILEAKLFNADNECYTIETI